MVTVADTRRAGAAMAGKYGELVRAIESVPLVDAHAHNIVALDSDVPFIRCFSEAEGEALNDVPHTLSFKRSIKDIAGLYGCEASLDGIQQHRKSSGLQRICSKSFEAAKISAVFIDDGITFDKMHDIEWHKRATKWEAMDAGGFQLYILDKGYTAASKVVALKSIAAYRSGLQIDTHFCSEVVENSILEVLNDGKPVRIRNKSFIDYILTLSLEVAIDYDLPVQIHTGFGDKDLDLRLSNPLHLRVLLEDKRFTKCRIVLLHASYPFSQEASYLASVYPNVYVDFGLAIPKLSVHGMVSSVKQLLELTPMNKVMFSTDGYAFPETFFLGAKRARHTLATVLCDACEDGDLTILEAIDAAKSILRDNALQIYKVKQNVDSPEATLYSSQTNKLVKQPAQKTVLVRVMWVDTSGQHRCRVIPESRFHQIVKNHGVGLTFASMGMTSYCDGPAEGSNLTAVGEIRLIPDLSTSCRLPWSQEEELVLADMHVKPGLPWEYCPREALRRVSNVLKKEFNLEMNAGFENEFFILRSECRDGQQEWLPFDSTSYCSTAAFDAAYPILKEVNNALSAMGISVEQIHAEAGNGQFEISLGHTHCGRAADNLILTRETIRSVVRKHGFLATFLPKYFLDDIGSGSHVHLSLWQNEENVFMAPNGTTTKYGMTQIGENFMAGVFVHLPSIMVFTAPLPNSYDRIKPNTWSGAFHCWGKENREAPLRTASPPGVHSGLVSNFEVKTFDGCANPYLGLAAIMAAGIDGLRRKLVLPDPVETNPSDHDINLPKLPTSLNESIEALAKDETLKNLVGEKLVSTVVGVKKAEVEYYAAHPGAYKQLIHRY
ncbi:fluG protein [Nymphaea thermarum]|nr:fluG protein [Nymphaea thermarum]